MFMNPTNRTVILTGATQGIGRATAQVLAEAGCKLALVARSAGSLHALADRLNSEGYPALAIPADVGDTGQAPAIVAKTIAAFDKLDVIINNAAIGVRDQVLDLDEAEGRRVMDVNYFGPLALIQAAVPHLQANPDGGLILNISSIVGRRAMPGIAGYCASKGALEKMGESLRIELKPDNIRVSTVYPGVTNTDFNRNSLGHSQAGRQGREGVPPARVAQTILKTIRREKRDVFITLFDRTFVTVSMLLPWLMDYLLTRHFTQRR